MSLDKEAPQLERSAGSLLKVGRDDTAQIVDAFAVVGGGVAVALDLPDR